MFFTFIVEPSEVTLEQGAPFEVGENNVVVNPDTHDAVPYMQNGALLFTTTLNQIYCHCHSIEGSKSKLFHISII